MAKKVFKEIIISLLLCLAIILLLGILLYNYVPMNKTIPNPVSYSTPENVKQELAQSQGVDEDKVIMTYEVDATDLNNYKKIQDYKPGKANPFSSYEAGDANGDNSNENNSNNKSNNNTTNNNSQSSSNSSNSDNNTSGGKFFQNKGTK